MGGGKWQAVMLSCCHAYTRAVSCFQLDREVFLIVDDGTRLPWLPQLATKLSQNTGGAMSIINVDKVT